MKPLQLHIEDAKNELAYQYSKQTPKNFNLEILLERAYAAGFNTGYLMAGSNVNEEILKYCEPHLDLMWAASIVGIVLDCDFRDAKSALR